MFDTAIVKADFSRAATTYDSAAQLQRRVRLHCLTLAQPYWQSGVRILDAGCGTGAFAREATQRKLGWDITGLDLSLGMCRAAKARHIINADATSLPIADASFDGVFSSLMLQWTNNPLNVLREVARVTRPGGRLFIATLITGTLKELGAAFAVIDDNPHLSDFKTADELLNAATQAGLRIAAVESSTMVERYPDVIRLMQSLKAIGATNKHKDRRRGLMTPFMLKRLERNYPGNGSIMASWHVLYLMAEKC